MFKNKSILITGGTGSFGQKFVSLFLERYSSISRIIIFSRDELKQHDMQVKFNNHRRKKVLRFFLGDVRDSKRLSIALENVDFVVHAAALKQVPTAEYNPYEFIKTNVLGANNLIESCIEKNVKKIIALSTDKAAAPVNLYGATKLCSDKLFVAANNIIGSRNTTFSVVRYGNVMGSRGSVIPLFLKKKKNEPFKITHPDMTRFNITLEEGANFVIHCLINSIGKEIFVPKLPSCRIVDLAKAIDIKSKMKIIGIRPGEKLHEEMITYSDSFNALETKNFYLILPELKNYNEYFKKFKAKKVTKNFSYNSRDNKKFLTTNQIKKLLIDI